MSDLKSILTWVAVVLGILSSLAWWRSATAKVPQTTGEQETYGGFTGGSIEIDGADLAETMRLQSKWNRWAAILAALCAFTQACATGLPERQQVAALLTLVNEVGVPAWAHSLATAGENALLGIVSGLYSGVIIARYSRFSDLRTEVLRVIRSINFVGEPRSVNVLGAEDLPRLILVASDLIALGHKEAGEQVLGLSQDIALANASALAGHIDVHHYAEKYGVWQQRARQLPANKRVLWSLWGRI